MEFNIPKALFIYNEGIADLRFKKIEYFLKQNFGKIKIRLIKSKKEAVKTRGLLFDFIGTWKSFNAYYAGTEQCSVPADILQSCHIILTKRLFATLDENKRPHMRAAIYSFPSVISIAGIVEGPAKPKGYYVYKQKYSQLGVWEIKEQAVRKKFQASFIDYADSRITEVLKGYISQALFFYITGEPFCKQKNCRLYNAHWQKELIYAQVKNAKFCPRHKAVLRKLICLHQFNRVG